MTNLNEIYKCAICGNVVEVVHASGGTLVCCGQPMTLQVENTVEASKEKHIPVIERNGDDIVVKIGSVTHPMEEKHYIEWIELQFEKRIYRKYLSPGEKPEACFNVKEMVVTDSDDTANCEGTPCNFKCNCCDGDTAFTARAFCNLHGLWKA